MPAPSHVYRSGVTLGALPRSVRRAPRERSREPRGASCRRIFVTRSWATMCAGLVLLTGCGPEYLACAVCAGPGAYVNVHARFPSVPLTVRVCVVGLDTPCTTVIFKTVDSRPQPGATGKHWVRLSTIGLELNGIRPRDLEGREVTVTIEGRTGKRTKSATFGSIRPPRAYRCGDQAIRCDPSPIPQTAKRPVVWRSGRSPQERVSRFVGWRRSRRSGAPRRRRRGRGTCAAADRSEPEAGRGPDGVAPATGPRSRAGAVTSC